MLDIDERNVLILLQYPIYYNGMKIKKRAIISILMTKEFEYLFSGCFKNYK